MWLFQFVQFLWSAIANLETSDIAIDDIQITNKRFALRPIVSASPGKKIVCKNVCL